MKTIYATIRGVLLMACLFPAPHSFAQISFTVPATPGPANVTALEYFIDTDPGKGAATAISITAAQNVNASATVNIPAGLSVGVHQLWVRAKSGGSWGTAQKSLFVVRPTVAYFPAHPAKKDITAVEYFFDADSGIGRGHVVPVTPTQLLQNYSINADISALQNLKTHRLFVRTIAEGVSATSSFYFGKGIAALPIHLLYFSAQKNGERVLLSWTTAQETDNEHYEIERSEDGRSYTHIATLPARSGNTNEQLYQAADEKPLEGRNYYRLKQVDRSGGNSYSSIAVVQFDKDVSHIRFNNPVDNTLHIHSAEQGSSVSIIDAQGHIVLRTTCSGSKQSIDVSSLPAGNYILKYSNGDRQEVQHLTKQ